LKIKNKVIIIGSQGYLGSRLSDYLKQNGYHCRLIDTSFFKKGIILPIDSDSTICKDARLIVEDDIDGFDSLILLAGISNDPFGNLSSEKIYNPTRDYALKIASMCKNLGVKFIYPSSCSVYGNINDDFLNEESQTNPLTAYSINKLQVEKGLKKMAGESFSPIALRLGTVFGLSPRIRFDVVINMMCGMAITENRIVLNSDGMAWRPHVHIDDVCESFRCCIDWQYNQGKLIVLNVGRNDANIRIKDIAKIIQSKVDDCELQLLSQSSSDEIDELVKDRKVQDGVDKRTYKVSFDKIYQILDGFESRWSVEEGIEKLILDLQRLGLTKDKFKQRDFYRLQQLEYLYKTNKIDENLNWKKLP
jgi:nucleoside-diphosphate-sugar epimerase